jgi:DNA-binding NarL/FixJ family response regulator
MSKITTMIMDYVESKNLDDDLKQDFYVLWLEHDFDIDTATDESHMQNIISAFIAGLRKNESAKGLNRERLMLENESTIRNLYSYDDVASDPLDIVMAEELEDEALAKMSDLEKDIYARVLGNGVPYKDVATELFMSEEAVRKHVSRIRRKFGV